MFLVFSASIVSAQSGPFLADVTIDSVSQTATIIEVVASHVNPIGFQKAKFSIPESNLKQNAQLAVLLTAVATGKTARLTFMVAPNEILAVQINN